MHADQLLERLTGAAQRDGGAGVCERGLDLRSVADDPRVAEQAQDLGVAEPRDRLRIEACESASEGVPLGKDRAPRQSRLECLEGQALEQPPLVEDGEAPLLVVIALEQGVAV